MSAEAPRILVVDDNPDVLVAARLLLKQQGYQVRTETDPHAHSECPQGGVADRRPPRHEFHAGGN